MTSVAKAASEENISWESWGDNEVINYLDPESVGLLAPPLNLPSAHWKYIGRQRFQPVFRRFRTSQANIVIKLLEERLYGMALDFIFDNYGRVGALKSKDFFLSGANMHKKCRTSLLSLFNEGHTLIAYDLTHQKILGILIARIHKTGFQTKLSFAYSSKKQEPCREYIEDCDECTQIWDSTAETGDKNIPRRTQQQASTTKANLRQGSASAVDNGVRLARKRLMRGNITHNVKNVHHNTDKREENIFDSFKKANTTDNNNKEQRSNETLSSQKKASSCELKSHSATSQPSVLQKDGRKNSLKKRHVADFWRHHNKLFQGSRIEVNGVNFDGNIKRCTSQSNINTGRVEDEINHEENLVKLLKFNHPEFLSSKFNDANKEDLNIFINKTARNYKNIYEELRERNYLTEETKKYLLEPIRKPKHSSRRRIEWKADREVGVNETQLNEGKHQWESRKSSDGSLESFLMDDIGNLFEHAIDKSILGRKSYYMVKRSRLLEDLNIKKYYYIHLLCGKHGSKISEILLHGLIRGLITWAKFIMPAENLDAILVIPRLDTNSWLFENAGFKKINQTDKSEFFDDEDRTASYEENPFVRGALFNDYCCYLYLIGQYSKDYWNYIGKY